MLCCAVLLLLLILKAIKLSECKVTHRFWHSDSLDCVGEPKVLICCRCSCICWREREREFGPWPGATAALEWSALLDFSSQHERVIALSLSLFGRQAVWLSELLEFFGNRPVISSLNSVFFFLRLNWRLVEFRIIVILLNCGIQVLNSWLLEGSFRSTMPSTLQFSLSVCVSLKRAESAQHNSAMPTHYGKSLCFVLTARSCTWQIVTASHRLANHLAASDHNEVL